MQGATSTVARWLEELAALAGIPATFDESGAIEIELASGQPMVIEVDEQTGVLLLSADLFAVPPSDRTRIFEEAMKLNHLGQGTGGAALGWDAGRDMLVLSALSPIELLDEAAFLGLLSGFIDLVDRLRTDLRQPIEPSPILPIRPPTMVRG